MRGYRFTPPLLAPAARVNSSQRSPISNRRSFSTPHPGLLRRLRWLDRLSQKLELFCAGSLRIPRPVRALRAPRNVILPVQTKKCPLVSFGPQNRHRPPAPIPTADDGRQNTSPGSRPGEKTLFIPKRRAPPRQRRPHKHERAARGRSASASHRFHQAVHRGTKPRARGSPHNQGKPIWPRRPRPRPKHRSSRAAWPRARSTSSSTPS